MVAPSKEQPWQNQKISPFHPINVISGVHDSELPWPNTTGSHSDGSCVCWCRVLLLRPLARPLPYLIGSPATIGKHIVSCLFTMWITEKDCSWISQFFLLIMCASSYNKSLQQLTMDNEINYCSLPPMNTLIYLAALSGPHPPLHKLPGRED